MPDRTLKTLRVALPGIMAALACIFAVPATGQSPAPLSPAQFDPSDVYFQGYISTRDAEKLEAGGDFIGALAKLQKADELFATVRKYYPDWKPEMVAGRCAKTTEAIGKVRPKSEEQFAKKRNAVAELEGGVKKSGKMVAPDTDPTPTVSSPSILKVDPIMARRLADAEAEVKRLRDLAAKTNSADQDHLLDQSRINDLAKQRDALQADIRAAETTTQALRRQLAESPMKNEVAALNDRIGALEQERAAMATALNQSHDAQAQAATQITALQADLKLAQQKRADLDRDLKSERNISNSVVAGMRHQLMDLEKELLAKNTQLSEANQRISGLMTELQESHDAFAQLRNERNSLLQERDQMSALLKLNEGGRIQDLIEQNMSLAKNLREANEKVDRLNRESNADKDTLTDAMRDLAIAKSQINRLHQDKQEQEKRFEELQNRLKNEEQTLTKNETTTDPAEVEVLRNIIRRQIRGQEHRRQARELLVDAAKDLGTKDERLSKAVELIDSPEIALTPEEQKLIANKQVDGEFVSPYARDRATVNKAISDLSRDIAVYERTAEKSYVSGHYLPTRELYEMILVQYPGHIPSLCKLGVVQLKLGETKAAADAFRRVTELDSNNPFAFRMLGVSLMNLGDLSTAEKAARQSVDLAPSDAKSHMLLAALCYRLGRTNEAESHFKGAITADPMPSEPYYNLALIYSSGGRIKDAKNYYQLALDRGGVPDPELEDTLAKH